MMRIACLVVQTLAELVVEIDTSMLMVWDMLKMALEFVVLTWMAFLEFVHVVAQKLLHLGHKRLVQELR